MVGLESIKVKPVSSKDPVALFLGNVNRVQSLNRPICFYRMIGMDGPDASYIEKIKALDMAADKLPSSYIRLNALEAPPYDATQNYSGLYSSWTQLRGAAPANIMQMPLPLELTDQTLAWSVRQAFYLIMDMYRNYTPNITESALKTFLIKMFYWIEKYLKPRFIGASFPKIAVTGNVKKHGSLFLLFCANIGCDILYIHPNIDFSAQYPDLLSRSLLHTAGAQRECTIPIPEYSVPQTSAQAGSSQQPQPARITTIPALPQNVPLAPPPAPAAVTTPVKTSQSEALETLTYEELAAFSSSVVMIGVFDEKKECYQTGSGVVISDKGYIITNLHVVAGGAYYAARYENDDNDYLTDTLVKYHSTFDLALIRVDRPCRPIQLKPEGRLARGQRIVAIGSPLGFFNTVSDGIISGFRQIDGANMIQFTAPVSHGSSGGALIDMYGRLVGIITGGMGEGQNLNLAIDHQTLYDFVKAFL